MVNRVRQDRDGSDTPPPHLPLTLPGRPPRGGGAPSDSKRAAVTPRSSSNKDDDNEDEDRDSNDENNSDDENIPTPGPRASARRSAPPPSSSARASGVPSNSNISPGFLGLSNRAPSSSQPAPRSGLPPSLGSNRGEPLSDPVAPVPIWFKRLNR
jgi:hypothetical protein